MASSTSSDIETQMLLKESHREVQMDASGMLTPAGGDATPWTRPKTVKVVLCISLAAATAALVVALRPQRQPAGPTRAEAEHAQSLFQFPEYSNSFGTLGEAWAPAPSVQEQAPAVQEGRICRDYTGVKLEEVDPVPLWPACSEKWTADCRGSGCCLDWGTQCYEKNGNWATCKATCEAVESVDGKNETWTCRVIKPDKPRNMDTCRESCRAEHNCDQAVFDVSGPGSCSMSQDRHGTVVWASDNFNSTICGYENTEAATLSEVIDEVRAQLPFLVPDWPVQECSWSGEDCSKTKCCNDVACDDLFSACFPYSCYTKNQYFASCLQNKVSPLDDGQPQDAGVWELQWIGGGRELKTLAPAGSQAAVQGTSLYCFMVVNWNAPAPKPFWSTEAQLADNIKKNGVGIFQCDGHDIFDGPDTPKAKWGSFSNIDAFVQVWQQVKDKGAWLNFDWTVKVDADAVFVPNRLKQHLGKLRTPKGARVYLENVDFQFKFMGALEILTQQALALYLDNNHLCIRGEHAGGEDFFMKGCMDGLGIDHQSDYELLKDKYASQDVPCTDGWSVAYHFHKKVNSWNWCYNEIMCSDRDNKCGNGIDVPFVMPFKIGMR